MKRYLLPTALFGKIALISYTSAAVALSPVEVQRIAQQTTVQIDGCAQGSGVIIQRNDDTYTVLTVAHAVNKSGCELVAPDNAKYQISQIKTFPNNVDLALFNFTSSKNYPIAKLIDNSDRVEAGQQIYVSGFPLSTAINKSVFTFVKGDVVSNSNNIQQSKGYSLIYSNNTLPGHSGGPVWSDLGEVIAIHGQGDVDTKLQETINSDVRIKTGFNLGITVNTFTKIATIAGISGYTSAVVVAKPKPVDDLIASSLQKQSNGDYQGSLVDMNQAIAIDSRNAQLYINRGIAKSSFRDNKGAIDDFNRALDLKPGLAVGYYNRGIAKTALGDIKGAIEDYNSAISLNPNSSYKVYLNRGTIKAQLGDLKGASEDYNLAIALNSKFSAAFSNRAAIKAQLGDKKGALEDVNRAIALNPNSSPPYFVRALLKSETGDKKGALEDFNKAIDLNSNYSELYFRRGAVKSELGDFNGAIKDFNRATVLNPNKVDFYIGLSYAKFKLGDYNGMFDDSNRALAIDPNLGVGYENRGDAKSKLGDQQGAISDWQKAARLYQQQRQTVDYRRVMRAIQRGTPE
jgi:lipoprotein NlpI